MALVTRCPDCATAFRITPLHLQAHGGNVRCGNCARVFNGFTALATMQEPEAGNLAETKAEETQSEPEIPHGDDSAGPNASALPDQQGSPSAPGSKVTQDETVPGSIIQDEAIQDEAIQDDVSREGAAQEETTWETSASASLIVEEPLPETATDTSNNSTTANLDRKKSPSKFSDTLPPGSENHAFENYPPENYAFDEAQPPAMSLAASFAWGFANLLLLVLLAAQVVYALRSEISVMMPDAKPYLERYCELLQCSLPAPQYAKLLNIESSEMQADAQRPGVITLNATVRNYASYSQALPSFQLTLIDTKNQPLASRTFPPDAYLEENSNLERVVAPEAEFNVKLHLDSGDLNAAGYRLLLLYPSS
ncbi:MJ0042 family finger-like domain-containing protein [Nitrosospira briensis]|uniref:MJ0042 family finger-like domain-containing protein n=1 Tax=Nitrosospira briensis TaxID=35799 RepID=A0A1I5EKY3_9PROT|nr:zinc-ribbon and DUF3426 domain-containing protein [Nitrosospira briensis]SFO12167.1 MJ0042 family finger-like domain-containing protein [Nitrosospira briensis]